MNDDELDRRLKTADRMAEVHVADALLDGVHADARAASQRALRRRALGIAGFGVLALGGLATAPAAADAFQDWLAIAEWQPEGGTEIIPGSDMIDLSAPDLPEYIASRFPEWLPIPPGTTRERMIDDVVDLWQSKPDVGFTQEVGFRYDFERIAYCGWIDAWLTSDDPAVVSEATRTMRGAIGWPAFNDTDADGVVPTFLTAYANAAEQGDPDGVQFAAWQYGCSSWDGDHRAWWIEENEWFQQNDPRQ
jgi:hypothetical protein